MANRCILLGFCLHARIIAPTYRFLPFELRRVPEQFPSLLDMAMGTCTMAAREYLRVVQLRELKAMSGKVDYQDAGDAMEALELRKR